MALTCPRDGAELRPAAEDSVPCQRCPTCRGEWLTLDEFQELEATAARGDALAGTIEYAEHPDALKCPSCGKPLQGFDFRGEDLQLDACDEEHGFWLDADKAERVRGLMRQRMLDLQRAGRVEGRWNTEREQGFKPTLTERLERAILGRRGL